MQIFAAEHRTAVSAVPGVQPTDPTGAGDSFIGALLSALARGADLTQAAVWACAVASFAIEQFGVQGLLTATPDAVAERTALITVNGRPTAAYLPPTR